MWATTAICRTSTDCGDATGFLTTPQGYINDGRQFFVKASYLFPVLMAHISISHFKTHGMANTAAGHLFTFYLDTEKYRAVSDVDRHQLMRSHMTISREWANFFLFRRALAYARRQEAPEERR